VQKTLVRDELHSQGFSKAQQLRSVVFNIKGEASEEGIIVCMCKDPE